MTKPKCFGTTEFNKFSLICKRCLCYIECDNVNPKQQRTKYKSKFKFYYNDYEEK